jgi:DNA-binding beta-propeller fold protein YncE
MVLKDNVLYVANSEDANGPSGEIKEYNANSGKFLGDLSFTNFPEQINPRGVVFGPDGQLYVAANQQSDFGQNNPLGGFILKVDTTTGAYRVVASEDGVLGSTVVPDLHRPEGLTFGPDGLLYVTSFRADASDTDKILALDATTGQLEEEINLDQVGQPRAYAQAIAFGPGGDLYVPITGSGPDTGSVRRYDVSTKNYTVLIAPGGPLGSAWYLTFGQTNPATLAYNTKPGSETSQGTAASTPATSPDPTFIAPVVDEALTGVDLLHPSRRRSEG